MSDPCKPTHREKGWLGKQIKAAQEEVKTWPQWMRDTAKFEGTMPYDKEDG